MTKTNRTTILLLIALLGTAGFCTTARAEDAKAPEGVWLAALDEKLGEPAAPPAAPAKAEGWQKPIPVGFYLDYTLSTDYIWRGINLSEYGGEGREKLNHMLTAGVNYDAGDFGTFDFSVWFEWYGANDRITGDSSDSSLQEVDYTFSWTYDLSNLCPSVPVELTLGWIGYDFPQIPDDAGFTNEYFIGLALDDKKLLGDGWFALNPTLTYYQDLDDVGAMGQGSWLEFGISHEFALGECPTMGSVPVIKDLTLTPSFTLMMDIGYLGSGTRVATNQYGLEVGYDLGKALCLPEQYGSLGVTGFLNYSDAVTDGATNFGANLNDEFWGGMSVGWEW
ncbi:MAG: hypothetical protein QGG25_00875 [Phycisphaerae bacterium]|nr:hypothetical protein [Phycisphaerae bacterium]